MERVRFNNCLNKPIRIWNVSVGAIAGGCGLGLIVLCVKGILWAFVAGVIGFAIGGWFMQRWTLGIIQRWLYWNLDSSKFFTPDSLPQSHVRLLI